MKTLAEQIAVMQAAQEGKKIERRSQLQSRTWTLTEDPTWNWAKWDYRVALGSFINLSIRSLQ